MGLGLQVGGSEAWPTFPRPNGHEKTGLVLGGLGRGEIWDEGVCWDEGMPDANYIDSFRCNSVKTFLEF